MFKRTALSVALLGATALSHADVLTSIKPLGFIASAITDGVTNTQVLLPVTASPHDYSLKPSDVEKLKSADLVVWVGDEMEAFLEKSIEQLPEDNVLTLEEVHAIEELVEGSSKDHHDHDHDDHDDDDHDDDDHDHEHAHHDHDHEHHHDDEGHDFVDGDDIHGHHHDENWHVWLSPSASTDIAQAIADRLIEKMPNQKAKIEANLAEFKTKLTAKNAEIVKQLSSVSGKGYYTFHDAYGYFEDAYGLTSLGSFTINPTVAPGAKTLAAIKADIASNKAQCLFAEPQFTPKVIETLSQGTATKVGQLDPLGAKVELGKDSYPQFLQVMADEFSQCLAN
ncbi:zinc ABC transporter substrate-binding protein ZnuA [Otariodibacter oris]|uniref:High-affinity zinc uptake system protein ZnuA n=1 Tax=Otariodibacter oris TaxID=1032623 RepID=A0A420XFC0_9PAST|nr:zinc ABC transporter substrate-binding protein ZnuA [Otariodibacter oris]QGM81461.1 zinc ABC transporter substrate-binding protein [Otariodibacter oris]RKR71062.1 zinc transport system substrate-binding protein [Otariodibacter oris]